MEPLTIEGASTNGSYRLVCQVSDHLRDATPRMVEGDPAVQLALRVFARLRSRYEGIGVLLAMNLADDAYALTRALMFDAERLQVMQLEPARRLEIVFAWMDKAVSDLEDRARVAERFHRPNFAADIRSASEKQRKANRAVAADLGVSNWKALPSEGNNLANRAGRPDDQFDYAFANDTTHSVLVPALWHDRLDQDGAIHIGANMTPWTRAVANRATRHIVRAAVATAAICDFASAADLAAYATDIERRLDAEELPQAD